MGLGAYSFGATVLRLGGSIGLTMAALGTLAMVAVMVGLKRQEQRWQHEAERTLALDHVLAA
jgi:hypothetical protein